MSQWTHVNGSIRIDAIRGLVPFKLQLGNRELWATPKETIYDFDVPRGSEGSLDYHLWMNSSESSIAACTLNIFGDLRDFGANDTPAIFDYLNRVTKGQMVRQGFVEIDVEGEEPCILQYINDEESGKGNWFYMDCKEL